MALTFSHQVYAERGQVVRASSNGLLQCQSLDALNTPSWTARIRGSLLDGGKGGVDYRFRITSCFATQDECLKYIKNIDQTIDGVDRIRSRTCSPRA